MYVDSVDKWPLPFSDPSPPAMAFSFSFRSLEFLVSAFWMSRCRFLVFLLCSWKLTFTAAAAVWCAKRGNQKHSKLQYILQETLTVSIITITTRAIRYCNNNNTAISYKTLRDRRILYFYYLTTTTTTNTTATTTTTSITTTTSTTTTTNTTTNYY